VGVSQHGFQRRGRFYCPLFDWLDNFLLRPPPFLVPETCKVLFEGAPPEFAVFFCGVLFFLFFFWGVLVVFVVFFFLFFFFEREVL